jgi:VIT1/CCC1 family predicted Fe2+/Mn2+ transporter
MMRRRAILAATAALSVLLLGGCSLGSSESGSGDDSGGMPQRDVGVESPAGGEGVAPRDEEQFGEDQVVDDDRSVISTGWLAVTVDDPIDAAAEAADVVERAGGRVESRSETPGTETQEARATLVVRVPAEDFDGVLAELRELGVVASVQLDESDVTQQRQDLDARIEALQASVDRLLALLAEAADTADLVTIESELTTRQAELDSLTAQRDQLVEQVDYSTLTVELLSEGVAPQAGPGDFSSGVAAGWNALVRFASGLLVVAGVLLPWLAAALVLGAVVTAIVLVAARARHRGGDRDPGPGNGVPGNGVPADHRA